MWLNSLPVMSNIKVLPCKTDGRTNTTHYIELYDTHMDQKCLCGWVFFFFLGGGGGGCF